MVFKWKRHLEACINYKHKHKHRPHPVNTSTIVKFESINPQQTAMLEKNCYEDITRMIVETGM